MFLSVFKILRTISFHICISNVCVFIVMNETEDFSFLVSRFETETQFTPCDRFSILTRTSTHTQQCVCSAAWDVNEMQSDGWTHVLIFLWINDDKRASDSPLRSPFTSAPSSFCLLRLRNVSDADPFLLYLSPSLPALQHALALHLPSFFPSLSPALLLLLLFPLRSHLSFSLSHSGSILHLSTSTFHAHLTPLLSPPLPLRHLPTPFILLLPFPHRHKLHLPFRSFFPLLLSHTLAIAVSCKLSLTHTHADWHPRTERTLSLSKDGVWEVCLCHRQAS